MWLQLPVILWRLFLEHVDDHRIPPSDLDARLKRIYDHLYANAAVRTPAAIAAEVGKLLRVASFIEEEADTSPAFSMGPSTQKSLLRGELDDVKRVSALVRERFREMNLRWGLYDDEEIVLSDENIAWVWATLEGVVLSTGRRDVFGDAIEIFRTTWAKQSSGQFFTDAKVTHLAMTLLRFDPLGGDDLIDICCGTGGFLLAGLDVIRREAERSAPFGESARRIRDVAQRSLRGREVDPEIAEVANASLLCSIGLDRSSLVTRGDSLRPSAVSSERGSGLVEGTHRCAAANPPFGTKITVKSTELLGDFELARGRGGRLCPRPPDILLLERNIRMLEPSVGRLAIVLPYQILSGPQTLFVRRWLLRQAHLEAVVDLPSETFQPHTGTKTSLLVVRRRDRPLDELPPTASGEVFMSTPRWIGHDRRGHPIFRRGDDGIPSKELLSDIEAVGEAYEAYLNGDDPGRTHRESFVVTLDDVLNDHDLHLNARYYAEGVTLRRAFRSIEGCRLVRLRDVTERIFCPSRFKRQYIEACEGAVPFLGGANIAQLLPRTGKWLSPRDSKLPELVVREGWLLVTRSGTTGIVSSVPRSWDGVAVSEHVIRIVPKPEALPPEWIQAYLRSDVGQRALARGVFGSVIDEITPTFVGDLDIPVPDDEDPYLRAVRSMAAAEDARDRAINSYHRAIEAVDSLFDKE